MVTGLCIVQFGLLHSCPILLTTYMCMTELDSTQSCYHDLQLIRQVFLNSHTNVYSYFDPEAFKQPWESVPVLTSLDILMGVSTASTDKCVCSNKSHLRDSWCLYHLNKETNFRWLNNGIIMCLPRRKARGRLLIFIRHNIQPLQN